MKLEWEDEDFWNFDKTICIFLADGLREFKERNHGYPGDMTEEGWDQTLQKMIDGFEASAYRTDEGWPSHEQQDEDRKKTEKALKTLRKQIWGLWD